MIDIIDVVVVDNFGIWSSVMQDILRIACRQVFGKLFVEMKRSVGFRTGYRVEENARSRLRLSEVRCTRLWAGQQRHSHP